jgi:hypothetical protein
MKLKHLFIIHAIIALGYAVCNLFTPRIIVSIYFVNDTPTAEVLLSLRYFSWGLLSVGLITAFAAAAPISEAKQAIVKALFLTSIVGLIVSLMGIFSGTFNAFGWSAVVIFVFLTAGYFYFWFIKPETA